MSFATSIHWRGCTEQARLKSPKVPSGDLDAVHLEGHHSGQRASLTLVEHDETRCTDHSQVGDGGFKTRDLARGTGVAIGNVIPDCRSGTCALVVLLAGFIPQQLVAGRKI